MLLHVVADYGEGDLAFAEVAQRLALGLPAARTVFTSVPPFATLSAGFCVAQLALNPAPPGMVVFHNVAPRRDDSGARSDNDGERLVYAELPSGVRVVGVNAGHTFSFVAGEAAELRYVNVGSAGSQFRSRDLFPEALRAILDGDSQALGGPVPESAVPPPPEGRIAYIDGYGNIKTTFRHDPFPTATRVRVKVGGVSRSATVAHGSFAVPQGELAFSPGSSGWRTGDGRALRFRELFLRGGSAWEEFGRPRAEAEVRLELEPA